MSCVVLVGAAGRASAQTVGSIEPTESAARTTVAKRATIADALLLTAARSTVFRMGVEGDAARWHARSVRVPGGSRRDGRQSAAHRGRSKLKTTLVGAALGGSIGAAGGRYYAEATRDGAYPQAIFAFAGIGAAIGGVTGFVVGLF